MFAVTSWRRRRICVRPRICSLYF